MADEAIGVSGLAGRYATALFELAKEKGEVDSTEGDLAILGSVLENSVDLRRVIDSPGVAREQHTKAMDAIACKMELGPLTRKFIGVLALNRRLSVMVQIIQSYVQLSAKDRGEASAEVASASPLSHDQLTELTRHLEHSMGKKVVVTSRIDPSLLGGLVVKVGSRMIDNSLSSKLERMKLVMKGIG